MKKEKDDYPLTNYFYSLVLLFIVADLLIGWIFDDNGSMSALHIVLEAVPILLLLLVLFIYMGYESVILWKAMKDEDSLWHKISLIRFVCMLALCVGLGYGTWAYKGSEVIDFWKLLQSCC